MRTKVKRPSGDCQLPVLQYNACLCNGEAVLLYMATRSCNALQTLFCREQESTTKALLKKRELLHETIKSALGSEFAGIMKLNGHLVNRYVFFTCSDE